MKQKARGLYSMDTSVVAKHVYEYLNGRHCYVV
jgi:hypothetical protein